MSIEKYKESFHQYMMKENSLLKDYFKNNNQITECPLTWKDIKKILLTIITEQDMYDKWNVDIIICDFRLEKALNVPYLHVSQLKHYVLPHFTSLQPDVQKIKVNKKPTLNFDITQPLFHIKPQFYNLLSTVPGFQNKKQFSFRDVCSLTSRYIVLNKTFFDNRNMFVVNVSKDNLGRIFNVNFFHRLQIFYLILEQLES